MRIAGIIFRIDAEKIKRRTSVSEENKVIDEVNTSGVVEQPVDAEEIPPVKTEAIPPVNTEPTHPVQPPVEPAQKLEDYYKETAEDRVAEEEYEQAVKDPQNRKESEKIANPRRVKASSCGSYPTKRRERGEASSNAAENMATANRESRIRLFFSRLCSSPVCPAP